jgi:hypothetical protein
MNGENKGIHGENPPIMKYNQLMGKISGKMPAEPGVPAKGFPPRTWDSFLHYLPYSEEDERLGMVCTTAGDTMTPPHTAYPPRRNDHPAVFRSVAEGRILPEFQLVYITEGRGIFKSEGKTWPVSPGSMMLVLPGIKHQYKPDIETGWHEYWVGFNGSYFKRLLEQGILPGEKVFFNTGLHDNILAVFNQIFDEIRASGPCTSSRPAREYCRLFRRCWPMSGARISPIITRRSRTRRNILWKKTSSAPST